MIDNIKKQVIDLLKDLISIESFSKQEAGTAQRLKDFFSEREMSFEESGYNIWLKNKYFNESLPTVLLNSHHDTVKPNPNWTYNPFKPTVEGDRLTGLGSNDAGGPLVSLIGTFLYFYEKESLPFNLVMACSSEEEISGKGGMESIVPKLGNIDFAIVGEPTGTELAVAEKGLMVLDCVAKGKAGHAAREEGVNAILKAIEDINWFHSYQFENVSETLGPVKMSVTQIEAGTQHNVVPAQCKFVVDVRTTDAYSNLEVLEIIRRHVSCEVTPRSTRLNPSGIDENHKLVKAADILGINKFGSSTLSDQALMPWASVKMGPGLSERSHTADEFIYLSEIEAGIDRYIALLEQFATLN